MPEFDEIKIEAIAKALEARVKSVIAPHYDINKDNTVTMDEVNIVNAKTLATDTGTNATIAMAMAVGEKSTYDELAKKYSETFLKAANALDTDKNGFVSKAEFQKGNKEAIDSLGELQDLPLLNPAIVAGRETMEAGRKDPSKPVMQSQQKDLADILTSLNTDGIVGISARELLNGQPPAKAEAAK